MHCRNFLSPIDILPTFYPKKIHWLIYHIYPKAVGGPIAAWDGRLQVGGWDGYTNPSFKYGNCEKQRLYNGISVYEIGGPNKNISDCVYEIWQYEVFSINMLFQGKGCVKTRVIYKNADNGKKSIQNSEGVYIAYYYHVLFCLFQVRMLLHEL